MLSTRKYSILAEGVRWKLTGGGGGGGGVGNSSWKKKWDVGGWYFYLYMKGDKCDTDWRTARSLSSPRVPSLGPAS